MIVLGIDPGSRHTALALVDTALPRDAGTAYATGLRARLLWSTTIANPGSLLPVPTDYLLAVVAHILGCFREATTPHPRPDLVVVEEVSRPRQHLGGTVARGGKGGAAADPTALLGTCEVRGAIRGRHYGPPLVDVPPGKYGQNDPRLYPDELLDRGGKVLPAGKRRHERAAYDLALAGPAYHRMTHRERTLGP